MRPRQRIATLNNETHHFRWRINNPHPIRVFRVIRGIKILIHRLQKLLLFRRRHRISRRPPNRRVIRLHPPQQVMAGLPAQKRLLHPGQSPRQMILLMKSPRRKQIAENLLGQEVLHQHFPHMARRHPLANGADAQAMKLGQAVAKRCIVRLALRHQLHQTVQHRRQIAAKLRRRLLKLLHFRRAKREKLGQQSRQPGIIRQQHPPRLLAVLQQHRLHRILEQDVVAGITLAQLGLDLPIQIVLGILGLPPAMRQPQPIQQHPIGSQ